MKSLISHYYNQLVNWLHKTGMLRVFFFILCLVFLFLVIKTYKYTFHKEDNIVFKTSPLDVRKDINGTSAKIKANVVDKETFDRVTDSFKRLLSSKRVQIKEVVKWMSIVDTDLKVPVYIDTSNGNFKATHRDNYLSFSLEGNTKTSKEANFSLQMTDTLTHIDYVKKHLLKSNERFIVINNKSPYWKPTEGAAIMLKEPKELFSISMQLGYNPFSNKPYIGIGVSKSIFTIKTSRK